MAGTGRKKKYIFLKVCILLVFLMVLAGAALYTAATYFRIQSISYEGTDRYTDAELTEYIFGDIGAVNLLKLKYDLKDRPKVEIPFIETYEINLEYPDKVHVVLYEKSIVAYVIYKESYMYFDKDGIVVETSNELVADVPLVDGLEFDSIVLYCPLPVGSAEVFNTILDLSQNLQKYEIAVDKIHFNDDLSIVLYIGDVCVNLGMGDLISEKLHELKQMESSLKGLSGVLHMENYSEGTQFITFKKNNRDN